MGLASALKQMNGQAEADTSKAQKAFVEGGFNAQNLGIQEQKLDQKEIEHVVYLKNVEAHKASVAEQAAGWTNGLVKPDVPPAADQAKVQVNELVVAKMWRIVCLRKLFGFFTQKSLQELVNRACRHDYHLLMRKYQFRRIEDAADLSVLGLFNIVLLADDSGSMSTKDVDGCSRWEVAKFLGKQLAFLATLFDADGISLRFFNQAGSTFNGLATAEQVAETFESVFQLGNSTPMAECLQATLDDTVFPAVQQRTIDRPVLFLVLTDGQPSNKRTVEDVIRSAIKRISASHCGPFGVLFSFAQVGLDRDASEWLGQIDEAQDIGENIDATSSFEIEKAQVAHKDPNWGAADWVKKTLVGPIDPETDHLDEASAPPPYGH